MAYDPDDLRTRPVTVAEVARLAGVSPSTVSRAFNRPGAVRPETAARIREAADALGYVAGTEASSSQLVAVTVSEVDNAFYLETLFGIHEEAAARGWTVILLASRAGQTSIRDVRRVIEGCCGAIMISPRWDTETITSLGALRPIQASARSGGGLWHGRSGRRSCGRRARGGFSQHRGARREV